MRIACGKEELVSLIKTQLAFFGGAEIPLNCINEALERTERSFSFITNKYYRGENGEVYFDPFHSSQYTVFLYYLSSTLFKNGQALPASKVYYLNKMLNSVDLFYEVELPEIFCCDHPLGAVMGRAVYGSRFYFEQQCTVGQNKNVYPTIGENVYLYFGAAVIGISNIGSNVVISANTYIKD